MQWNKNFNDITFLYRFSGAHLCDDENWWGLIHDQRSNISICVFSEPGHCARGSAQIGRHAKCVRLIFIDALHIKTHALFPSLRLAVHAALTSAATAQIIFYFPKRHSGSAPNNWTLKCTRALTHSRDFSKIVSARAESNSRGAAVKRAKDCAPLLFLTHHRSIDTFAAPLLSFAKYSFSITAENLFLNLAVSFLSDS